MARPVQAIPLTNSTLEVLALPRRTRDEAITRHTITLEATAEVEAQVVTLSASSDDVVIIGGTSLSFISADDPDERQQVLIKQDVILGTTAQTVTVSPLFRRVTADSTAEFIDGLQPLFGIQTFDLTRTDTTVDVTNMQSGTGTEMAKVRQSRVFQVSGIELEGDRGLNTIIKPPANYAPYINREVWAVLTRPNGERFEGAAITMNYSEAANQNEVIRYSFQLQYQGDPIWTPAYRFL